MSTPEFPRPAADEEEREAATLLCKKCNEPIDRRTALLKHDCDHHDAWWCANAQPPCPVSFCCTRCNEWTPTAAVQPTKPPLDIDREMAHPPGLCGPGCTIHDEDNEMDSALDLIRKLAHGGTIVSSAACSVEEVSEARADGRLFVDDEGCGYVYRQPAAPVTASVPKIPAHHTELISGGGVRFRPVGAVDEPGEGE